MPKVRDLVGPEALEQYPDQQLDPRAVALLELEVPPDVPVASRERIAAALRARIPNLTIARRAGMISPHVAEVGERLPGVPYRRAALSLAEYRARPRLLQLAEQAGVGAIETLPSPRETPLIDTRLTPQPRGTAEEVARGVGGAIAYGAEATAATLLGAPGLIAAGLPAALAPGTIKKRTVGGVVMGTIGALVQWVPSAVTQGLLKAASRQAPEFARAAAQRASEVLNAALKSGVPQREAQAQADAAAAEMLKAGAERAVGTIGKAAKATQFAAGTAGFGGLAAYAEVAGRRLLGEDVEWPKTEEIARSLGIMAVLGAPGLAGRGRGPARPAGQRGPEAPTEPPRAPSTGPGPPTAPGPFKPLPILQSTAARAAFVSKLPGEHRSVLLGVLRNLDDTARNPFDQGRTALQGALARVQQQGVETAQTPEQVRAVAAKARREVKALEVVRLAAAEPPGASPEMRQIAQAGTQRWNNFLAGRGFRLQTEEGPVVGGIVERVVHYPYPGVEQPFRVIAHDQASGQTVALMFKNPTEFAKKVTMVSQPAAATEEMAPAPEAGAPTRRDAGGGREAAAGPILMELDLEGRAPVIEAQAAKGGPTEAARARPAEREAIPAAQPPAQRPGGQEPKGGAPVARAKATGVAAPARALEQVALAGPVAKEFALAAPEPDRAKPSGKTFAQEFEARVTRGTAPDQARAEAEDASGESAPRGFDAEARAGTIVARAREAAGQQGLFAPAEAKAAPPKVKPAEVAAPQRPAPGPVAEKPKVAAGQRVMLGGAGMETGTVKRVYGSRADVEMDTGGVREVHQRQITVLPAPKASSPKKAKQEPAVTRGVATMRAQSLHFHEPFQQRDVEAGLVDPAHVQTLLQRHQGYSPAEMEKQPITVWRDTQGEIGPEGRVYVLSGHHRAYIAQRDWRVLESGEYAETSVSDREVPVVFQQGDYASALEEAETSNLKGKPNTLAEQAGVARRLLDRGKSLKQVADLATGGNVPKARDLVSLSYVDRDLLRAYFGEKGLPLSVGAYLGEFVRRHNVHPEHQRGWVVRLADGRIPSRADLEASIEGYLKLLNAANQTSLLSQLDMGPNAISEGMAQDYLGRVFMATEREARTAAAGIKAARKIIERGGTDEQLAAAKVLLNRHREDFKRAEALRGQAEKRALRAVNEATASGGRLADALYEVKQWLEKEMGPQTPQDWGGEMSMLGTGAVGKWLGNLIQRGVPNAIRRAHRRQPGANDLRIVNSETGEVQARYSLDEALDDPWTNSSLMRWAAMARVTGAREVFTPELSREYQLSYAREAASWKRMRMLVEWVFGGREGLRYFGMHGTGAKELSKALRGEAHAIPERHRGAIARYKKLIDMIYEMDAQHAEDMGLEKPQRRADYGHAHIVEGAFSGPVPRIVSLLEGRKLGELAEPEIEERKNRFYNRREGDPNYVKDATFALEQRIFESVRKWSWDPFLLAAEKYLQSEAVTIGGGPGAPEPRGEAIRAQLVAQAIRTSLFRKRGAAESFMDRGLKHLFFAELTNGVQEVPRELAVKATGKSAEELKLLKLARVYWVPAGTNVHTPEQSVTLHTKPDGSYYVGVREGHVYSMDAPVPREFVSHVIDYVTDKFARATLQIKPGTEAELRHQAKVDQWVRRLERDPTSIVAGLWTGGVSRALMGYNVRATHVNAGSTLITTLSEYGAGPYLAGVLGATKAAQRRALRAMITAKERAGFLSAEDASAARDAVPVLRDELFAEAAGVQQGEIQMLERRIRDIMDGKDPDFSRVVNATGPFGMFAAAEGWNRTLAIIAAHEYAVRLGMPEATEPVYTTAMDAHRAMLKAIGQKNSAETFAALGVGTDQFSYNPLGQPTWYTGPFGRIVGQLGTWPLNYAKNYVLRTTAGAFNVARASARGFADLAGGGRLGRARPKLEYVGPNPPPKNWFEAWLDYNGATFAQRHAAAVFVRQMVISAILVGFTEATNVNVAVYGVNPVFVAGLWLLHRMFPDNETITAWLKHGTYGATINVGRGFLPWPLSAAGPTVSLAFDVQREAAAAFRRYEQTGDLGAAFPWGAVLPIVRRQLLTGEVEIKRLVREFPEKFQNVPWVYDWLGIKYVYPGLTPGQKLKHQVGLTTEAEEKQARERVRR